MTEAVETKPQQMLRMSEHQANYVALAQRVHNQLMQEGAVLIQQGQAKQQQAALDLRMSVEGAFKEQDKPIPTAEVRIVNDERGRPAVLVWTDPPEKAEEVAGETESPDEQPKAAAPTNGKTAPEAAKRKLPIK